MKRAGRSSLAVVRGPLVVTGRDGRRRLIAHNVAQRAAYLAVDAPTVRAEGHRHGWGRRSPR